MWDSPQQAQQLVHWMLQSNFSHGVCTCRVFSVLQLLAGMGAAPVATAAATGGVLAGGMAGTLLKGQKNERMQMMHVWSFVCATNVQHSAQQCHQREMCHALNCGEMQSVPVLGGHLPFIFFSAQRMSLLPSRRQEMLDCLENQRLWQ